MTHTTTEPNAETPTAGPMKRRGLLLLKVWGALYAVVALAYAVHGLTGAEYVHLDTLSPGRRLWTDMALELDDGREDLVAGETLAPEAVEKIAPRTILFGAFVRQGDDWVPAEDQVSTGAARYVRLYRRGTFHNLPWATGLGLLNLAGVALLLFTFLGDPVPAFLDEHARQVRVALDRAKAARMEDERLRREHEKAQREVDAERERSAQLAERDARKEHDRVIADAKKNAEHLANLLETQIQAETQVAIDALRARIAARLIAEARMQLAKGVDEATHAKLVAGFANQLEKTKL